MPRNINSNFHEEKNRRTNQPIFLYVVYDYDGNDTNLRLAEHPEDIIFQEETYQKFPITHEFISENTQGQIDSVTIRIGNISREIQAYLEDEDWRGKKVEIYLVWKDKINDEDCYIKDVYYIDTYSTTTQDCEFTLTTKFDLLNVVLPGRRFTRNYCQWKFKSNECGYSGNETSCNKTFQRCLALENSERFGGFPGIPMRRVYFTV